MPRLISSLASLSRSAGRPCLGRSGSAVVVSPPLVAAVIGVMLLVMTAVDPFRG